MEPSSDSDDEPTRLFGDARSPLVQRGPDRRSDSDGTGAHIVAAPSRLMSRMDASSAVRLGGGDLVASLLAGFALVTFVATIIGGILILYNAKTNGAFSNPWDSTRVAIGIAVLAIGLVLSALLLGVSRAISYLLASLRLRALDLEMHGDDRLTAVGDDLDR